MIWPQFSEFSSANFLDHFDGSLNSRWTAVTSGSGAVTLTDSYLKCDAPANSAAFVYRNAKLDKTKSQLWQICWAQQSFNTGGGNPCLPLCLFNGASAPTADTGANHIAKTLLRTDFYDLPPGAEEARYYDSGGTRQRWNPATPAWATGFAVARTPTILDDYYITALELDGPNARWRLMGLCQSFPTAGTWDFQQGWRLFYLTDWVLWANTRSNADIWLVLGYPSNDNGAAIETRIEWVRYSEAPTGNKVVDSWSMGLEGSGQTQRLRHYYSYDGVSFVPQDRTTWAIDIGAAGQPDDNHVQNPRAVWDGASTDWLFYAGHDGTSWTICVASATHANPQNGPWTKYASNPVIPLGTAGADDDTRTDRPAVVRDLSEPDSNKQWKMLYVGEKASDNKLRIRYATASAPTGPWTKQGTVIDVGSAGAKDENECTFPVLIRYGSGWEVWYEGRDASGISYLLRAHGTDLASLTKDTTDYTATVTSAKQALTAALNSAPGRTVTVGSTTGFVADAPIVVDEDNTNDNFATSRIRKIVSSTQLELYHGLTGYGTAVPAKIWQRDGSTNRSPRAIVRVGSEWWFYTTVWDPWFEASDDATYGTILQENFLFKHASDAPNGATASLDELASPVAWRGFNSDARTVENLSLLDAPYAPSGLFVFDTFTSSTRTGTQDPYTFNHTAAAADVAGVIVAAAHGTSSTDHITGITYGGVSLTRYQTNTDTANEPGRTDLWFVGDKAAIPDGTQTVSVDLASATTDDIHFVCMTLVAPGDTVVINNDGVNENVANPSVTMNKGGKWAMSFAVLYAGGADATTAGGTIQAGCQRVATSDLGAFYSDVLREDNVDPTDQAIGFSTLGTDDVAFSAIAVAMRGSLLVNPRPLAHLRAR